MQSGYEETELALPKLSAASARRTSWPFSTTQGPAQGSPRPPSGPERVHSTDEERGLRRMRDPSHLAVMPMAFSLGPPVS